MDYTDEIFAHAEAEHPGETVQQVNEAIQRRRVSQAHAQGRNEVRIVHCRACNKPMQFSVGPADPTDIPELCEAHRG